MDYNGLYEDLRAMSRRAINMARASDARTADRIWAFENECWTFANELFLRGYGCD